MPTDTTTHGLWITPAASVEGRSVDHDSGESERRPTWWMRRNLAFDTLPEALAIEVVCLGYYELYVNGKQAGDEPLAPSITRFDRRGFAIRHEVASLLRTGENCIAIWCSSGWYLPHQFRVHEEASPLLRIRVLRDGEEVDAATSEWLCRPANRSITGGWAWDDFGGEEVDAGKALPEWNRVGCDVRGWLPARTLSAPPIEITERTCPPNRIGHVYPARSVRRLGDRRFEVDFGTCLSGWVDVDFGSLERGQTVTLRFYDLPADNRRNRDHSYRQVSVYRAGGGSDQRFRNKFNYAGFRYMTIEGIETAPPLGGMRAMLVECALEQTGQFHCSNELYNRIHALNLQTLRCLNLGGYSVDCPHRERNGYGADGQTALPAYLYLLDSAAFLRKWLTDWCDVHEPETGRIANCAPTHHPYHAPAWGGIVVPLAWALYLYYGDRESMVRAFPAIQGYLRFLQKAVRDGVLRKDLLGSAFHGDWVPPGRGMDTENEPDIPMRELFNSCYLIYLWQLYTKICRTLGRDNFVGEAEANIAGLREGIHREFYDADAGCYLLPEQIYQAMPLMTGVVPQALEASIRERLIGLIEAKHWHMDAGLPGTTFLLDLLMQLGEHDVIGRIYAQESYPGWGYMLAEGATTIWEQWNGFWSQIHSCFAGPAAWFYAGLAGIRPDEANPGFAAFHLAPAFLPELDFVTAAYLSVRGRIESAWRREGSCITWSIAIPEGSRAIVSLPLADTANLQIDGKPWSGPVQVGTDPKGCLALRIPLTGGHYTLQWPGRAAECCRKPSS